MATTDLNAGTFDQVIDEHPIVLVDFWAQWCQPCLRFGPTFEQASEDHPDIVFGKVDTDAEPSLTKEAGIKSVPTLMAFREGILLFAQRGAMPSEKLDELITAVRDLDMEEVRANATMM